MARAGAILEKGRIMWRFAWQNLITRPTRTFLAVLGLTIPIIAILGLFSLTGGIRTLMGNTLAKMNGLMVMRANSPAPVFSEVPASMADVGTHFSVDCRGKAIDAVVVKTPFYRRQS